MKWKIAVAVLTMHSLLSMGQRADGVRIRFNGFGDSTAGHTFGGPVSSKEYDNFKKFGEDPYLKGVH